MIIINASILLLIIWSVMGSNENCELLDELIPFANEFNCTTEGKYSEDTDQTCSRYVSCIRSSNHFITLYLTCPNGSKFDPDSQECSIDYLCTQNDESIKRTTRFIDYCDYNPDPDYFKCVEKGRFMNYNDVTCGSYFLCSLLSSGRMVQSKYNCPGNATFNPHLKACQIDYYCPCRDVYSTTTEDVRVTTNEDVTDVTTNKDAATTGFNDTDDGTTVTTTDANADQCVYNKNPEYFNCTVKGRYKNDNDPLCRSYFLCNVLKNGRSIKTRYNCPENSYFNPNLGLCDMNYRCPCTKSSTPSTASSISSTASSTSTTESSISSTASSISSTASSISSTTATASSSDSTQNPTLTSPDDLSSTTPIPPNNCTRRDPNNRPDAVCAAKGRYPNEEDPTCSSYFLCSIIRDRFLKTMYNCPNNTKFNPSKGLCDVDYKCPVYCN